MAMEAKPGSAQLSTNSLLKCGTWSGGTPSTTLQKIIVLSIASQNNLELSAFPSFGLEHSSPDFALFRGSLWYCQSNPTPCSVPGRNTRLQVPSASTLPLQISPSHVISHLFHFPEPHTHP